MAGTVANIEKLDGANYATWCIQMKSLLITLDLYHTLVDKRKDDKDTKWITDDSKALATITLSVKTTELIHIKNCTSAKSAWDVLQSLYKADTASRKVNLFKKLVRFKLNANEKFSPQINDFCCTVDDLKEIGVTVNDDLLSILLLCSLPDELESFVVAMESRDSLPKYDQLISKILEEEMRQGNKNNVQNETVFAANSRNVFKRNKKSFNNNNNNRSSFNGKNMQSNLNQHEKRNTSANVYNNNIKCFRCGKKGHIRSQCKEHDRKIDFACSLNGSNMNIEELWILDSGATSHMCRTKEYFETLTESRKKIVSASGESIYAEGMGVVKIQTEFCKLTLKRVWYVPQLHSNFVSISKIVKAGHTVKFAENKAVMKSKQNQNILTADLVDDMFIINEKKEENCEIISGAIEENMVKKWHQRFGHLNVNDLNKLTKKSMVKGLNVTMPKTIECVTCAVNKIAATPYKNYANVQTKNILELVHTDLCGPIGVKSVGGSSYFITFIDDYSRYISTYFLKNKSDAYEAFIHFSGIAETQTGRKIKIVRSDNGKEFVNSKFKQHFAEKGIVHQTTVGYSPQQNGVSERANRTLVEMARCLLESSGLPQSLWGEAINTATYLRNRAPTKVLDDVTPYERWHGRQPSVSHLKTFGCDAVMLKKGPKPKGGKFLPKGEKIKFVGYQSHTKGYRLYKPSTRQILIARDVIFFEKSFDKLSVDDDDTNELFYAECLKLNDDDAVNIEDDGKAKCNDDVATIVPIDDEKTKSNSDDMVCEDVGNEDDKNEDAESKEVSAEASETSETEREDSPVENKKRKRGRPKLVRDGGKGRPRKIYCMEDGPEMLNSIIENPNTVNEALNSENSLKWKEAMNVEYNSLIKNKTWQLVDKPINGNIIGCKWVFALKRKPDGSIEKYKARLVAHGCSQKHNVDYQETFSPVVRHSTIRLLLALSAKHQLLVNHIDIVAAYLNGDLEDDVYMVQPKMFEDKDNPNKVCKLNKALYGLKQAGREWNRKVNDILLEMGFKRCKSDTCVYVQRSGNNICLIAVYVDDMLLACSSEMEMKNIIENLNKYVEAVDRGPISFYLGMEIIRDGLRGNITIHQQKYVKEILDRWGMTDCKPTATPWASGTVLKKCDAQCKDLDTKNYQSLVGALMYLVVITRPDLIHVVSRLSQFNSHPHTEHFQAAKYVLRYLKKNPIGKITFSNNFENFECFTDSDWGCDSNDRKSYSGHVVFMAGGPVAWESRKQPVVALSTMEAEYIALCQGAKEVVFHRGLLNEMGFNDYIANPTPILCDNQGAAFMVKNPTVQKKSKHIDIRYHYIREVYEENAIDIKYVTSEENAADILTKCLVKQKHLNGCKLLKIKM